MSEPLVSLEDVSVRFDGPPVLDRINLRIDTGDVITLIGPNGAGKTTLVRTILGIQAPDSGRVWRRSGLRIGYMPQRLQLPTTLPLQVSRFLAFSGADPGEARQALDEVGVPHLARASVHHLSGGELQRVLLARAILRKPRLLVLDEPAQGVDVAGQAALYELIQRLREQLDCAVLTISHDLHLVMSGTDQVICLNQHICCQGHPEQVSHDPAFIDLFGRRIADSLAVYHHHHNHGHDLDGHPVPASHPLADIEGHRHD